MYHNMGRQPDGAKLHRLYATGAGAFGGQMWLLRLLGYCGVSTSKAMTYCVKK